jgi:NDP-sugar pyrophosphorylase family protein
MKLVILAAGEGVRMRPLTLDIPKPLIKILGKPIIEHIFLSLPLEISEVIVVVKYLGKKIQEYCGNEFYGKPITYVEGSPFGSASSFLAAKELLKDEERFLFIHGDDLPYKKDVERCLKERTCSLCFEVPDPWNSGVAIIGEDGFIKEIIEKSPNPPSNLVSNGVMVITNKIFECIPQKGDKNELSFSSMFGQYVKKEKVVPVYTEYGAGGFSSPSDIQRIEKILMNRPLL